MATTTKTGGYRAIERKVDAAGAARANVALRALTGLALRDCGKALAMDALWDLVLSGERRESEVLAALDAAVAS